MENKQDGILTFDTLFTNNHICMMKLLLPLLSPSGQKNFAIYIKYLELQYTLQFFARHPYGFYLPSMHTDAGNYDYNNMLESLLPYCTPREKESISQMRNMMNTFRNMQDMMEMMNTLKELFPEGFDTSDNGGAGSFSPEIFASISNIFGNGSPDISQMADLLQGFQGNINNS